MSEIKEKPIISESTDTASSNNIVLFNDSVNTFEFVIDALMYTCDHVLEQAEQCAMIVHTKGKCNVKSGDYETLKPICETMSSLGLTVEIQ